MSRANSLHRWGAVTLTQNGTATAIAVGSYYQGMLFLRVSALSGTNPRLRPRWEAAPGTDTATAGPFGTVRLIATMLATGVSIATLSILGTWGRPAWVVGGTSAAIRVQSWFVGSW